MLIKYKDPARLSSFLYLFKHFFSSSLYNVSCISTGEAKVQTKVQTELAADTWKNNNTCHVAITNPNPTQTSEVIMSPEK